MKKNIAVIFGGRSVEHDISILTGLHAIKHIENYRIYPIYLTRENQIVTGNGLFDIDYYIKGKASGKRVSFSNGLMYVKNKEVKVEAVLNCCHGGIGESGDLAKVLEVAGVPITSCNYNSAKVLQSKFRTREILSQNGFVQPKYMILEKNEFYLEMVEWKMKEVGFDFPVIVKPDTLGSSIGINIVKNQEELSDALTVGFELDDKVIIEEFLKDITEINCSAVMLNGDVKVSSIEEINNKSDFLDFETKYLDSSSGFISKGKATATVIHEKRAEGIKCIKRVKTKENPNDVLYSKIKELTKKAYQIFDCSGVVRADFMVANDEIYLNEINTVPGFLAYHLWARRSVPYGVLIDDLVKQAVSDHKNKPRFKTVFKSDILEKNRVLLS